jgi:cystathionine beta-lyase
MTARDLEAALAGISAQSLAAAGHLKWTLYGPGKLGAFVAEMDFGTAPVVTAAMHDAVDAALLGYLPPAVADGMRLACAGFQSDVHHWTVDPAGIVPVADVITGLAVTIEHLTRPGSPVILPTPAYMPFFVVPGHLGRETIPIEMAVDGGRYVYDLDALDRAFVAGGELLVLCNPHNPLGRVMERAELLAIADVVARHGGRVFADEIHAPLVYAGHEHVPYASLSALTAGHTVTATSASKAWNLAGLKCAQLILTNDADRLVADDLGPVVTQGVSTLGVIANTAAYRDGRAWLDDVRGYLDGNRRLLAGLLAERLPEVRSTPPEGTYLAWLDCRGLGLPVAPADFFDREADVVLVDGARCGPAGAGFVRLNLATTRDLLTQMVVRMAAAVRARDGVGSPEMHT